MSDKTGIQWTDATWNPIRGCSRVSEGCRNCYAEVVAARFSGPGQPYEGLARRTSTGGARWTGKIMFVEKHLEDPLRWKKPKRIFVNSMSDLFHEGVSLEQLAKIFAVMMLASQHTFQILTKRPERMRDFLTGKFYDMNAVGDAVWFAARDLVEKGWEKYDDQLFQHSEHPVWPLSNVWCGVSVEDQHAADERIPVLLQAPAAIRFLSCEPLLGPVHLIPEAVGGYPESIRWADHGPDTPRIDWVIVGGESGTHARDCDLRWIRDLVWECQTADVPIFVKQLGGSPVQNAYSIHLEDSHGGDIEEWAPEFRVREFPGVAA